MLISLKKERLGLEQIRAFLDNSAELGFESRDRAGIYRWISDTLRDQSYQQQGKPGKGLLRRYVVKMTGLSRSQVTRLITQHARTGEVKAVTSQRRNRFAARYTRADMELLAEVDEAHETLSGPATRKILQREFHEFNDLRYQRLEAISSAHIYNLRKHKRYRERRVNFDQTRPTPVSIGERKRPQPEGRAGYLRVDTVHQGDRDGVKGIYHINAVDEVTQWQVVGAAAQISEAWLMPVLERMLEQFPFPILGFHSDNGSEFINHSVSKLLNKLLIEQTKSRPRHSNDNGLVETKNGSVIRKHIGFGYIGSEHADLVNGFFEEHFNPYLNYHRPCGRPELVPNARGKVRRVYRTYATPWETLRQFADTANVLKRGLTVAELDNVSRMMSDTAAAKGMQEAKRLLFARIWKKTA